MRLIDKLWFRLQKMFIEKNKRSILAELPARRGTEKKDVSTTFEKRGTSFANSANVSEIPCLLGKGRAHEGVLLLLGLEATVAEFGRGIDELELDLFLGGAGGLGNAGLAEGDDAFLNAGDGTLDHDVVLVDLTVVGETTNGGDSLDGKIVSGGGVGVELTILGTSGAGTLANSVDLLVHLSTVVVTVLTGASDGELDASRVPSTDTGNLAQTTVGLAGKTGDTPTGDNTFETLTLRDGNGINHVVLGEDSVDGHGALEELEAPVDLSGDVTTVDLDLGDVGLLLTKLDFLDVGVADQTNDAAVLLHASKLLLHVLVGLVSDASSVAVEGLFLAAVPVLVEHTLDGLAQVLGPDGGQSAETTGSLDVADQTDDAHGRGLEDGDSLDNLLFVELGTRLVDLTHDVGHTGLVAHEGGQMGGLGGIIAGERANLTAATVVGAALAGKESQGPVAGSFKLTVRHFNCDMINFMVKIKST